MTLGQNNITVSAVNFDRSVKIQFGSGAINFDNLVVNGNQIDLTSGGPCPGTSTQTLTINSNDDASFAYGLTSYCELSQDPSPVINGVTGGTFSSTSGLVINSSTGEIDLDSSTAGTYVVTYSTASTEQTISTSNLFSAGPNSTWPHVYTTALLSDGASSQSQQTMSINITSLPQGGANYRVVKTTSNGNWFQGNPQALTLGQNNITVSAVNFDRSVKIQFGSGAINFDNLVVNGNQIDLNSGSCPGTFNDTITILQVPINNIDTTLCFGDSIFLAGSFQSLSGTYIDTIFGGATNFCDSIVVTSLVIRLNNIGDTLVISSCDSLEWNGTFYSTTGLYTDTLQSLVGCDSLVSLDLTINNSFEGDTLLTTSCDSLDWNGLIYYSSGIYSDTLQTLSGCDSIVFIDLTINNSYVGDTLNSVSCDSLEWNGTFYNSSGIYIDTLQSLSGCDSLVSLDLTINSSHVVIHQLYHLVIV